MKTHFKKASKSPYLGSWDLPEMKPIVLTISKAEHRMSKGLPENAYYNFISFKEKDYKDMLVNTTNGKIISALAGSPYIEDWVGTSIEIGVKQVQAFGEKHDALRVTTRRIKTTLPKLTKDHPRFEEIKKKYKNGTSIDTIRKHFDVDEKILK